MLGEVSAADFLTALPIALACELGSRLQDVKSRWAKGTAHRVARLLSNHIDELERKDVLLGEIFSEAEGRIMGEQARVTRTEPERATRLIRLPVVMSRFGLGRSTIYRWMAEDKFPKPVQLGGHLVAWPENEIEAWISSKIS